MISIQVKLKLDKSPEMLFKAKSVYVFDSDTTGKRYVVIKEADQLIAIYLKWLENYLQTVERKLGGDPDLFIPLEDIHSLGIE